MQHLSIEHPGIFMNFMAEDGITWDTVNLNEGESIPELRNYCALICMGGPIDVWEEDKYPWLAKEKGVIRQAILELKIPYLGICLGHQLLVDALGGKVLKMIKPEVGVLDIKLTPFGISDPLFSGLSNTYKGLQWHGAEVIEPFPNSTVLARSHACGVQAIRFGKFAYGLQYHVEITQKMVSEWSKVPTYQSSLEQAIGSDALKSIDAEVRHYITDLNRTARIIYDNFFNKIIPDHA